MELAITYAIGDLHGEVTLLRHLLIFLPFGDEDTFCFISSNNATIWLKKKVRVKTGCNGTSTK